MASAACYRPPLYLYGSNTPVDGSVVVGVLRRCPLQHFLSFVFLTLQFNVFLKMYTSISSTSFQIVYSKLYILYCIFGFQPTAQRAEPEFVNVSEKTSNRFQGIDLSYRPARLHRLHRRFIGIDFWAP
jgi:hypothetical protein